MKPNPKYTCTEYRQEMLLLGLKRQLEDPELSDGLVRDLAGFTVPRKDVTKVTSNIMVRDGCTVIIGGLMTDPGLMARSGRVLVAAALAAVGLGANLLFHSPFWMPCLALPCASLPSLLLLLTILYLRAHTVLSTMGRSKAVRGHR